MKQGNWISGAVMAFGVAAFGAGILVALNLPGTSADERESVVIVAAPAPVVHNQQAPAELTPSPAPTAPAASVDLIPVPQAPVAPAPVAQQYQPVAPAPYYGDDDAWDDDEWDDDL